MAARRYLVVANQTLGGDRLMSEIRRRISAGPSSFYILVPETPPLDVRARSGAEIMSSEGFLPVRDLDSREDAAQKRAYLTSQARLERLIREIRSEGGEARGDLGDSDALKAIDSVMSRGERFDEVLISTLPTGASRWLRVDLPHKVERKYKLPVTTVRAKSGD